MCLQNRWRRAVFLGEGARMIICLVIASGDTQKLLWHFQNQREMKMRRSVFAIARSLWLLTLASNIPSLWAQTTQVQQLGSSGKFRITNEQGASDPNSVTVEVDSVFEGPNSGHGTPTMANQVFTISSATSTTVGNGVPASLVTFATTLETTSSPKTAYGTLKLDTYIIKGSGTVSTDKETFNVNTNDVKFNILLSNWTFDTASEYVDVKLIIKGTRGDDVRSVEKNVYDLGASVPLILSGRVTVDGAQTEMASGYPRYTNNGNKYTFEFRFPRFTKTATYDPIVGYSTAGACSFPSTFKYVWASVSRFFGGEP